MQDEYTYTFLTYGSVKRKYFDKLFSYISNLFPHMTNCMTSIPKIAFKNNLFRQSEAHY